MVALYIIAGIIIFFAVILSFNVSLKVKIDSDNKEKTNIYAKIGFYKIYIIPPKPQKIRRRKRERTYKVKQKKEKPVKPKKEKPEEEKIKEKKKLNISAIINLAKNLLLMFWKKLRKFLKFKIYKINVAVASKDSYKTSQLYATVLQSSYYLYEFLTNNFKVVREDKDNIKIVSDFCNEKLSFNIDIKIYIRISHLFNMGFSAAISFVKFWFKSKESKEFVDSTENKNYNKIKINQTK